jgi:hypothetical protein
MKQHGGKKCQRTAAMTNKLPLLPSGPGGVYPPTFCGL